MSTPNDRARTRRLRLSSTTDRMDRRELLRRGGLALSAAALGPLAGVARAAWRQPPDDAPLAPIDTGWIDGHVHVWTPDTDAYPLAEGWSADEMQPASFTPQELFAHAGPCDVGRIVLIQMSFYGYDNSYMLDAIRRYPGRFAGVAVIDHRAAVADIEAAMTGLRERGVRGLRIRPGEGESLDAWAGGEGMQAMWKLGARLGVALCGLLDPSHLGVFDALCAQHPDTPAVVDHFARIGMDGTVREADVDALCRLARHRHTHVKLSAFYALGAKRAPYTDLAPMVRRLVDAYGRERLMWASDCPFQVQDGHTYEDSIALVRDRLDFLSEAERQWLLRGTAQRLFFA